jgi:hypothetical protein
MLNDRRTSVREIVNRPAKIREGSTAAARACTIRDFSEKGVRLYVPGGLMSDQFTLLDRAPLSCRVVWRLRELVGADSKLNCWINPSVSRSRAPGTAQFNAQIES